MSGRGASTETRAEFAKDANRPFHLFELYLDDANTFATDAYRTVVWNGNTYVANGHFLDYDGIEETAELSAGQTQVTLSGVDQAEIAAVLLYEYIDRRLVIRKAFLADDETIIVDPVPILDGRCDAPAIVEDPDSGTCTVVLTAGNEWIDFERRPGRHTNHQEQQLHFPGDMFFEFVSEINKEIKWGVL
jgi:hypothetical protein